MAQAAMDADDALEARFLGREGGMELRWRQRKVRERWGEQSITVKVWRLKGEGENLKVGDGRRDQGEKRRRGTEHEENLRYPQILTPPPP